eukprot:gene5460-6794_t
MGAAFYYEQSRPEVRPFVPADCRRVLEIGCSEGGFMAGLKQERSGLYAVGVFLCFTLSQAGMVVHWIKCKGPSWLAKALVNSLGSLVTAVVTGVLLFSKFKSGAWLIVVLVPILVALFL